VSFEADTETVRAALSDAEDPIMREERDESEGWRPALDALYAMHVEHKNYARDNERLREGLREIEVRFADAREHARALLDGTETPA